mmetsp:Transcript_10812/g.16005  ORF Transcript_10812/g.16005 Transcript_10812/m.16005 type:complete len:509 (+) Transcript_10812:81-1607(+)
MKFSAAACTALVVSFNIWNVQGFATSGITRTTTLPFSWGSSSQGPSFASKHLKKKLILSTAKADDDDEEETPENPYADPNYPELEFVNYDDPNYVVDQGQVEDEYFTKPTEDDTLEQIEAMREERRKRNDEFQFETYHTKVLKNGQREYCGEWTTYRTSTFLDSVKEEDKVDANGMPRLLKAKSVLRMVSSGKKVSVETESDWRVDGERIEHCERVATEEETQGLLLSNDSGDDDDDESLAKLQQLQVEKERQTKQMLGSSYVPVQLSSFDFRGQQGNMIVGNAYTVCDTTPLPLDNPLEGEEHDGPFQEMRTEIGIQDDGKRFRVKFDYRVQGAGPDDEDEKKQTYSLGEELPPLLLSSLTVCREALDRWPISTSPVTSGDDNDESSSQEKFDISLFGPPGAPGGLYDPPPVGKDSQAAQYMVIDLEGGASILFPFKLDQDPNAHDGGAKSWVTSLDWSVGKFRYQVDRKVLADKKLKGLKTLELSEVQSTDADTWRPTDGGEDMRQ